MQKGKIKNLIRELKKGKKERFAEFYELTKASVWYVITNRLRDTHKAEDVMQESYVAFLKSLARVDEDANPLSYLLTLARNKALDEYKKHKREDLTDEPETYGGREEFASPLVSSPLIELCKQKLDPSEYELIELTVIMGYKRVEVAHMLNKPISTVNRQYHAALKKAESLYKEAYDEY